MTEVDTTPVQEVKKSEDTATEVAIPSVPRHPLKNDWTYWYLNDDRNANWEDRLKKVATFNTVEDFWALYNNIRPPSALNYQCDYNVFRKDIQPMWEVPENQNGGRWLITIERNRPAIVMDTIWLEIILSMIGEQYGDDMENICGLVCNVRTKGSKISMWTRDHNDDDSNMRIGNVIKNTLMTAKLPDNFNGLLFDCLKYEDHASTQKKSSSSIKPKLTISSTVAE